VTSRKNVGGEGLRISGILGRNVHRTDTTKQGGTKKGSQRTATGRRLVRSNTATVGGTADGVLKPEKEGGGWENNRASQRRKRKNQANEV